MKIIRELRWEDVRRLCINEGFYTFGTNDEYYKLAEMVTNSKNITDSKLIKIAKDILIHSRTDYSLDTIITMLNEQVFIRIKDGE